MVAAGAFAGFASGSLATGVTVYLGFAALIQLAVVLLTAAGASGPSYLTEGRLTKLGSGLLHLGFIVFGIVVAALQRSAFMLPVFWVATVLITLGTIMSFYANQLAVRHVEPAEQPIAF
jgi:FtsH-binding integral membrane protein